MKHNKKAARSKTQLSSWHAAVGIKLPANQALCSLTELLGRDWTENIAERLLGPPDFSLLLQEDMFDCFEPYYKWERVLRAESSQVFQQALAKAEKPRSLAPSLPNASSDPALSKALKGFKIWLGHHDFNELLMHALEHYNQRNADKILAGIKIPATVEAPRKFLVRITHAYVRHECSTYDQVLAGLTTRTKQSHALDYMVEKINDQLLERGLLSADDLKLLEDSHPRAYWRTVAEEQARQENLQPTIFPPLGQDQSTGATGKASIDTSLTAMTFPDEPSAPVDHSWLPAESHALTNATAPALPSELLKECGVPSSQIRREFLDPSRSDVSVPEVNPVIPVLHRLAEATELLAGFLARSEKGNQKDGTAHPPATVNAMNGPVPFQTELDCPLQPAMVDTAPSETECLSATEHPQPPQSLGMATASTALNLATAPDASILSQHARSKVFKVPGALADWQTIRAELFESAQAFGYSGETDFHLQTGAKVMLHLEMGPLRIACYVPATTDVAGEAEQIKIGLRSTYPYVMICSDEERFLKKLAKHLEKSDRDDLFRIRFGDQETIMEVLKSLSPTMQVPMYETSRGVRFSFSAATSYELSHGIGVTLKELAKQAVLREANRER